MSCRQGSLVLQIRTLVQAAFQVIHQPPCFADAQLSAADCFLTCHAQPFQQPAPKHLPPELSIVAILLSLLAIVFLLVLQRVCQSRQLTPPPLRLPLIAAVAIPILTWVLASIEPRDLGWLTQSVRTSITLLWIYGGIRVISWVVMLLPSELGVWKPIPKILRDLLSLAIATAITLVVIHRDFQVNLVGLAATSAVITAVIGLAAQETLKNLFAGISLS